MARYPKSYFLEDLTTRILVGSACLVVIAIKSGNIWNFSILESMLSTDGYVGKFRKMADGIVSTDSTYEDIESQINKLPNKIGGIPGVSYWKYNPLWEVIFNRSTKNRYFCRFIENICDVPELHPHYPNKMFYLSEEIQEQEQEYFDNDYLYSDYFDTEQNLFFLTALARKAIANNQWHLKYRYGLTTRQLFPHIVTATPELFIRWPLLAKIYSDTFWSGPHGNKAAKWDITNWKSLNDEMDFHEKEARKAGVQLPPPHIFQRLNAKYLKTDKTH